MGWYVTGWLAVASALTGGELSAQEQTQRPAAAEASAELARADVAADDDDAADPADPADSAGPAQGGAREQLALLAALRAESLATRRELQTSVLVSGIASIAIGVGLAIPGELDQGLRFAGFNTLAFGAVNTLVGGIALAGIAEEAAWESRQSPRTLAEQQRYQDHALADESREAWGHGINLGLAGAYGAIGGMAVVVSQLDVAHPNRWLGSGVAILAQAAHLAAVDLVGTLTARAFERRMRALSPTVAFDPITGAGVAGAQFQTEL